MHNQRAFLLALLLILSACQTPPEPPPSDTADKVISAPPETPKPIPPTPPVAPPTETKPATKHPIPSMATPANQRNSQSELKQGLTDYANGAYGAANQHLQNALTIGLASAKDRINANKHLAFIACANGEQTPCRYHFRKVLLIDPRFELSATEAGHPLWGPVFKEIKAEMKAKTKTRQ